MGHAPKGFWHTGSSFAFQRTIGGARRANVSADSPHPAARRGASAEVLMAWTAWLEILMVWLVKRRRKLNTLRLSANPAQEFEVYGGR